MSSTFDHCLLLYVIRRSGWLKQCNLSLSLSLIREFYNYILVHENDCDETCWPKAHIACCNVLYDDVNCYTRTQSFLSLKTSKLQLCKTTHYHMVESMRMTCASL